MNLGEIAAELASSETKISLEKFYRKTDRKHPWLSELLMYAYDKLASNIKFRSTSREYVSYTKAAQTIDNIVLTISMIYDKKIDELEKQLNESRAIAATPNSRQG